jgi:hypothetical protein
VLVGALLEISAELGGGLGASVATCATTDLISLPLRPLHNR